MEITNTEVFNFEGSFRGLRNPMESHIKSDSCWDGEYYILGEKDLELAYKLVKAGSEHRKFLRQIIVSIDMTLPLYIWKEMDTYKVGVTSNSYSTMHKLSSTPITFDCFEWDDFDPDELEGREITLGETWIKLIADLESLRVLYNITKNKAIWKELIRLLPESWLQTRTLSLDYENLLSIYYQRKNHKLSEWKQITKWIETLPYTQKLFGIG